MQNFKEWIGICPHSMGNQMYHFKVMMQSYILSETFFNNSLREAWNFFHIWLSSNQHSFLARRRTTTTTITRPCPVVTSVPWQQASTSVQSARGSVVSLTCRHSAQRASSTPARSTSAQNVFKTWQTPTGHRPAMLVTTWPTAGVLFASNLVVNNIPSWSTSPPSKTWRLELSTRPKSVTPVLERSILWRGAAWLCSSWSSSSLSSFSLPSTLNLLLLCQRAQPCSSQWAHFSLPSPLLLAHLLFNPSKRVILNMTGREMNHWHVYQSVVEVCYQL